MKQLLFLLFSFLVLTASAQELPGDPKDFDWKKWEAPMSSLLKTEHLKKLEESKDFEIWGIKDSSDYEYANYHPIDFNGDNIIDVIYDGKNPSGMEINNVAFFLNDGDSLRLMLKLRGDFTKFQRRGIGNPINFQMIQFACCADFENYLMHYSLTGKDCFAVDTIMDGAYREINDPRYCVTKEEYVYVNGTEFPKALQFLRTLYLKQKAFFTPAPMEATDTVFSNDPDFFLDHNEVIAELPIGTECIVLAEKKRKGERYYFVMLKNPNPERNYLSYTDCYQYGWINKKRFN